MQQSTKCTVTKGKVNTFRKFIWMTKVCFKKDGFLSQNTTIIKFKLLFVLLINKRTILLIS